MATRLAADPRTGTGGPYWAPIGGPDCTPFDTYDADGELTSVTAGYQTPQQTAYETLTYTSDGNLSTLADGKNNLTTWLYDGFDRVTEVEYPSPTTPGSSNSADYEGFSWDANSNLLQDRRRDGSTITYGYDALNRATSATFSANTAWNRTASYDLLNRPVTVAYTASGGESVGYTWDALSNKKSETVSGGPAISGSQTISYGYDAAGDLTSITWPDTGANALEAVYTYDALQRVSQITANSNIIATYSYDQYGRRSTLARNNGAGATTTYSYDGADRLVSIAEPITGNAVAWTLTYDPSGNVATRAASNSNFIWHPGAASQSYTANGRNQYTSITGFTSPASASTFTTSFDPAGRLATKVSPSGTATFLFAGSQLIGEYDSGTGAITWRYIPGPGTDETALIYDGPGTSTPWWLHADQQGSTVAWSNGSGGSIGSQAYDPYGQPSFWGVPRIAYTGQLMLGDAQLYHFKARAYDPAQGRFLQSDPAGYASDVNLYAYGAGSPINITDPTGMACVSFAPSTVVNPDTSVVTLGGSNPAPCNAPHAAPDSGAVFGGGVAAPGGALGKGGLSIDKILTPSGRLNLKFLCALTPSQIQQLMQKQQAAEAKEAAEGAFDALNPASTPVAIVRGLTNSKNRTGSFVANVYLDAAIDFVVGAVTGLEDLATTAALAPTRASIAIASADNISINNALSALSSGFPGGHAAYCGE